MPVVGRLLQIRLFPVKSLDAPDVTAAEVDADGLRGDRGWVLCDHTGEPLRAKSHPALRRVGARAVPGGLELALPGSPPAPAQQALPRLADLLGHPGPLALHRSTGGARQVAAVHVVTLAQLGGDPAACGGEDPRANLLLDLPGAPPPQRWAGARLRVGPSAELLVDRPPRHCAGLYTSVLAPGPVRVGDAVRLEPGPPRPGD
ncbi:MOSC N-terminal beta barrel domain-containing protein [Kineococcus glutinatus]|uniref:Molybdenum cofactor sulfurase middle domain-containing protein n=1 Tax=Kineococcus glutinatus TaxID=1070872 RepID=A0ABP9H7R7_9ACTN